MLELKPVFHNKILEDRGLYSHVSGTGNRFRILYTLVEPMILGDSTTRRDMAGVQELFEMDNMYRRDTLWVLSVPCLHNTTLPGNRSFCLTPLGKNHPKRMQWE
jgi:hypothetical protein